MHKYKFFWRILFFISSFWFYAECDAETQIAQTKEGALKIESNKESESISVFLDESLVAKIDTSFTELSSVQIADFNFDGWIDFAVLTSEGQEKLYDVYLFNPLNKSFEFNKRLSEIPCLEVNQKKKTLLGRCFKSSACENWTEEYQWKNDELLISRKEGTTCDISTGKAYHYIEYYRNGIFVNQKTKLYKEPKK